ncbi:hypothetical protein H4R27_004645 [Coemansia aciculifera]|uniref:YABBY protein C-terminal domain-containing protein n=1 Tax=Coemansia pectinata TaxID=1052879 RepID=A0A9W8LB54_9FUNG|nr:hypothetical protein GGI17_002753 [Coemansia sp. S146]KAJ2754241.1 hypothetical protein GGI19_002538 [Coemansia pectinata]KAJ2880568.1 hypothetical protein H4R27_004645 [Coemansia aciculifera]
MSREKVAAPAAKPAKAAAKPKTAAGGVKKAASKKATGGAKKLSKYNIYMKTELAKVKSTNPGMNHRDAFKEAASHWKTSPENPINAKA